MFLKSRSFTHLINSKTQEWTPSGSLDPGAHLLDKMFESSSKLKYVSPNLTNKQRIWVSYNPQIQDFIWQLCVCCSFLLEHSIFVFSSITFVFVKRSTVQVCTTHTFRGDPHRLRAQYRLVCCVPYACGKKKEEETRQSQKCALTCYTMRNSVSENSTWPSLSRRRPCEPEIKKRK